MFLVKMCSLQIFTKLVRNVFNRFGSKYNKIIYSSQSNGRTEKMILRLQIYTEKYVEFGQLKLFLWKMNLMFICIFCRGMHLIFMNFAIEFSKN